MATDILSHVGLSLELQGELKKFMQKALIKDSSMPAELQSEALDLIISAIDKNLGNYETASKQIKESMDKKYGPTWHCIIGEGFAFDITFQHSNLLHVFYQGNIAILLYKC